MSRRNISPEKRNHLTHLATPGGAISALAIDQRKSLRRMIARAANVAEESVADERLTEFKAAVTEVLSRESSAVLIDPDYGLAAIGHRSPDCGLLLTYEMDGFENPRPHRMLALLPQYSARRLAALGAQGIKILLHYAPDGNAQANDEKRAWIERIGAECADCGILFFLNQSFTMRTVLIRMVSSSRVRSRAW